MTDHDELFQQYREHDAEWVAIGFPSQTYLEWLEHQVTHWRTCANAAYRDGVLVYSDDDITRNLQQVVNAQQNRIAEGDKILEAARSAIASIANYHYPTLRETGLGTCADWLLAHGYGRPYIDLCSSGTEWKSMATLRYEVAEAADRMITEAIRLTRKGDTK